MKPIFVRTLLAFSPAVLVSATFLLGSCQPKQADQEPKATATTSRSHDVQTNALGDPQRTNEIRNWAKNEKAKANSEEERKQIEALAKLAERVDRHKQVLLHATDHRLLLSDCRDVIKNRRQFKPAPPYALGIRRPVGSAETFIHPLDTNLPKSIRDLGVEPSRDFQNLGINCIKVSDDELDLHVWLGHLGGYGLLACRSGHKPDLRMKDYRTTKVLVDGLWYYEHGD